MKYDMIYPDRVSKVESFFLNFRKFCWGAYTKIDQPLVIMHKRLFNRYYLYAFKNLTHKEK
jgi:hypothetical protein